MNTFLIRSGIENERPTMANKSLDTYYFYDGLGNIVQVRSPGEAGQQVVKNYVYDAKDRRYAEISLNMDLFKSKSLSGQGVLVKVPSSCRLSFNGNYAEKQSLTLYNGWNLVAVQSKAFGDKENRKTNCNILGGPLTFDKAKMVKDNSFKPGVGYWVKVKTQSSCTITAEPRLTLVKKPVVDEDMPPLPPDSWQIEPQGGRGRRYVEDAG